MGEFELIKRYFTTSQHAADVLLGIGDDAAVLAVPEGQRLVAAVDTLVAGVHFPVDTPAAHIGYRALAVNLSDMAAMGAVPRWFTLSLCLPEANSEWLREFSSGLLSLAAQYQVQLVGGDTVKGPLNISVQIIGTVESDAWLTRAGAKPGDVLFVSGTPGDAAGGLRLLLAHQTIQTPQQEYLLQRFYRPQPRVTLGRALRTIASAAMDVSDGLLTDLHKLCEASQCGASLDLDRVPKSAALTQLFDSDTAEQCALNGGDDYELLFTAPPECVNHVAALATQLGVPCARIGVMTSGESVQCWRDEIVQPIAATGYDHFTC